MKTRQTILQEIDNVLTHCTGCPHRKDLTYCITRCAVASQLKQLGIELCNRRIRVDWEEGA